MQPPHRSKPRVFGEYLIHRVLGEGGMGVVYEAEERLSRRRVALKVLRPELGATARGRQQFLTEMAILANLDDPHIVRCLHCAEIEGQLAMVLELLEGQTLRAQLGQRGRFTWPEVVRIAWQIASALQAAHAQEPPVIHRDLKPENVMVLPDGRIKVMDFGIAKVMQTMIGPTSSYPVGTLQYMSPEHIDARPLDARADLYSLGLLLWELLAGYPPFVADSPRVLLDKLCTEPAPPLPAEVRAGMPASLEHLIIRLLEKQPDRRPRNATEVLAALEQLSPQPVSPAPIMPGAAISHAGPRSTPAAAASAVAAASAMTPMAAASASGPTSQRFAEASASDRRPLQLDTVSLVAQAEERRRGPLRPILIGVGVLALVAGVGVTLWQLYGAELLAAVDRAQAQAKPDDAASNATAAAAAGGTAATPATPAPATNPAACEAKAGQWRGSWELATEATQAIKSSWIGARSSYTFELTVDGCRLSGSGRKFTRDKGLWSFTADGKVADDGTATLHYQAKGRNIAGTWTLSPSGDGSWRSDAGDVSGTLTIARSTAPSI